MYTKDEYFLSYGCVLIYYCCVLFIIVVFSMYYCSFSVSSVMMTHWLSDTFFWKFRCTRYMLQWQEKNYLILTDKTATNITLCTHYCLTYTSPSTEGWVDIIPTSATSWPPVYPAGFLTPFTPAVVKWGYFLTQDCANSAEDHALDGKTRSEI